MHSITHLGICLFLIRSVFCEVVIECNKESSDKLDEYVRELSVFGDPMGKYPVNETDLLLICQKEKESLVWVQRYITSCLKGLSFQVTTLVANDLAVVTKKYCDSQRLRKFYISWGRCGNSVLNETVKCWNDYVLGIERINVEKEKISDSDLIALTCCEYHQFDRCIYESFHAVGKKDCPTTSAEGLHNILTEVSGKVLELLCGDYQADNDKCDSLLKRYSHLKDVVLNKPLRKSPVNAFIQIIDNTPQVSKFMVNANQMLR